MFSKKNITTGVVTNSNYPEWVSDLLYYSRGTIDLDYESWKEDNSKSDTEEYQGEGGNYLIGFVKRKGTYKPKKGEKLVCVVGDTYTQILKSDYITLCRKCSPCYPDQGDVETEGDDYFAYTPPPEAIEDDEELKERIMAIPASGRVNRACNDLLDRYLAREIESWRHDGIGIK